jgi:hypothetical protein
VGLAAGLAAGAVSAFPFFEKSCLRYPPNFKESALIFLFSKQAQVSRRSKV